MELARIQDAKKIGDINENSAEHESMLVKLRRQVMVLQVTEMILSRRFNYTKAELDEVGAFLQFSL